MLRDFMEREYYSHRMRFGKFNRHLLSDVELDWAYWWLNKREEDETHGICELDFEHKIAAERKYNFNRTYLFLIYHIYKQLGTKRPGNGAYEDMAAKFWVAIDHNVDFGVRGICNDEIDSFFYSVWSREEPSF